MIPIIVNKDEYWMFHVTSMEGAWLLQKITRMVQTKDEQAVVMGHSGDMPVMFLKRTVFTAQDISKVIGIPPEKLEANTGPIKIGVKPVEGLPEPTVPGYGEA